ncbi:flagellar export protein FliJ [Ramlibacter sp.]|uniref:flagellar export protein FliJ n=1 Tax=Ramlibacter sp. TaxID=1917967 RepID=UPI003D0AD829
MSLDRTLPLLIERAVAARDREAQALAQTQRREAAAAERGEQLCNYRVQYLARSPAATGASVSGDALASRQRFIAKLDEALAIQKDDLSMRARETAAQHARLLQCQQALLALQTLQRRREAQRDLRLARGAQREADEFAARALQRARREHSS